MAVLLEVLARVFLPARCALCGRPLLVAGSCAGVCGSCWDDVAPARPGGCPRCGEEVGDGEECLACRRDPPPWQAAASLGEYGGALRELILLFKNQRRDELARPLARLLRQRLDQLPWPRPDAIVPVPAWWGRRLRRGFDHADLLARHLAALGAGRRLRALRRRRPGTQAGRTRREREALPRGTFTVRRRLTGHALLVDDVLTTGATARACTHALHAAGATAVSLLTVARTPRPGRIP
ncbi:MAG: ComF family protein [Acidobacteriota bacterium]|jgi:ComF family protein